MPPRDGIRFSQSIYDAICAEIAQGSSLRQICARDGMPNRRTFDDWRQKSPELQAQYDRACLEREDVYFEQIVDIADTEEDPRRAAVKIDARKWTLKCMNRKKYGDQVKQELTGEGGGPIQHVVSAAAELLKQIKE
jgi:hypothetical protein